MLDRSVRCCGTGDRARAARADPPWFHGRRGGRNSQALSARGDPAGRHVHRQRSLQRRRHPPAGHHRDLACVSGPPHRRVRGEYRASCRRRRHGSGIGSGGMQVHLSGRPPYSAGVHPARGTVEPRRIRSHPAQFAHAGRACRRPERAVCRQHGGRAQRDGALRALRHARDCGQYRGLPRFHREALPRRDQPPAARPLRGGRFSRWRQGRRNVPHPPRVDGRQGQARFRFHRLRFAACQRAQHSVPGAARNGLHRCEEPARPGGTGQRRLLPDDEHRRAPGLRRRSRPAGCHRLPLDLRERAGRCHRPGDVAGDTGQGARGQRPPSSLRAGRHRSAQRQLLRQL